MDSAQPPVGHSEFYRDRGKAIGRVGVRMHRASNPAGCQPSGPTQHAVIRPRMPVNTQNDELRIAREFKGSQRRTLWRGSPSCIRGNAIPATNSQVPVFHTPNQNHPSHSRDKNEPLGRHLSRSEAFRVNHVRPENHLLFF